MSLNFQFEDWNYWRVNQWIQSCYSGTIWRRPRGRRDQSKVKRKQTNVPWQNVVWIRIESLHTWVKVFNLEPRNSSLQPLQFSIYDPEFLIILDKSRYIAFSKLEVMWWHHFTQINPRHCITTSYIAHNLGLQFLRVCKTSGAENPSLLLAQSYIIL